MAYGTAIRKGLSIAGRIDKKYNINKIFIQKYAPPHYRARLNKIVDIAGAAGGGYGLYGFAQSLIAPDTPGNDNAVPQQRYGPKAYTPYKTRGGPTVRNRGRYSSKYSTRTNKRCTCPSKYHRS